MAFYRILWRFNLEKNTVFCFQVQIGSLISGSLDIDPKFSPAYIGQLCAQTQTKIESDLAKNSKPLTEYGDYAKAIQFADNNYREILNGYNQVILDRIEYERQDAIYRTALNHMDVALEKIEETAERTRIKAEGYLRAKSLFDNVRMHKEAMLKSQECETIIGELKVKSERLGEDERLERERLIEEQRIESERLAEESRIIAEQNKTKQKKKLIKTIAVIVPTIITLLLALLFAVVIPHSKNEEPIKQIKTSITQYLVAYMKDELFVDYQVDDVDIQFESERVKGDTLTLTGMITCTFAEIVQKAYMPFSATGTIGAVEFDCTFGEGYTK